jgi:RraA family protein
MASKPRSAHLHPGPGFRVCVNFQRPSPELIRQFGEFPTPDISDLLNRLYAVDPEIQLLTNPQHKVCGPACTVKVFRGDNLMVHKSLDVLEPGDVVIVDAGGSSMNAVLGDLVSTKAKHRGAVGFIVDGLVRDLPNIAEIDFPVFARGTSPIGPLHRGPGEINYAICCGGVVVQPGDIIVGDSMGVVVIPQGIAVELLERLQSHAASNASYFESVKQGNFSNAWVDKILTELECPMVRGSSPAGAVSPEHQAVPAPVDGAPLEKA